MQNLVGKTKCIVGYMKVANKVEEAPKLKRVVNLCMQKFACSNLTLHE